MNQIVRTYKYNLLPSRQQYILFEQILDAQCALYNAALQERIDCYNKTKKSLSFFDQLKSLAEIRSFDETYNSVPSNLSRGTLKRLDVAFKSFFKRVKHGETAGFPRFRSRKRFKSFSFNEFVGIRLKDTKCLFKAFGKNLNIKTHLHRPLPKDGKIVSCQFVKVCGRWKVCLQVKFDVQHEATNDNFIAFDAGIRDLVTNHIGDKIPTFEKCRKLEQQIKRKQRQIARSKRGSKNRQQRRVEYQKLCLKKHNQKETYFNQIVSSIVKENQVIFIEDLNIKNMILSKDKSSSKQKQNINRSLHETSIAIFYQKLCDKAESAGRKVIKVAPHFTSQMCPQCGHVEKKPLTQRQHECKSCGLACDRDHAAAMVIYQRGLGEMNKELIKLS